MAAVQFWSRCRFACVLAFGLVIAFLVVGCDSGSGGGGGSDDGGEGGGSNGGNTGTTPTMLSLRGDIQHVHDPVMAKEDGSYYVFSTGFGIPIRCSDNLLSWSECGNVLGGAPAWARRSIPGVDHLWAPDIIYMNDRYHLYYSASSFGQNRSAIGVATNATLDQDSDAYEWTDQGMVVKSFHSDDYNAIDPNVVIDQDGTPWMAFGSYWSGIKMVQLEPETGKPASEDYELFSLARRPEVTAVEAPFIIFRDGYYYLFVSFDRCCEPPFTYNIRVGRAEEVTGPYVDRADVPMMEGGGTLLLDGTDRWEGTGHQAIFEEAGTHYLVYHAYDAQRDGIPTLRISPLVWENGWPEVAMQ